MHLAHKLPVALDMFDDLKRYDIVERGVSKTYGRHLHLPKLGIGGQRDLESTALVDSYKVLGSGRYHIDAVAHAGANLQHMAMDALFSLVVGQNRTLKDKVVRSVACRYSLGCVQ